MFLAEKVYGYISDSFFECTISFFFIKWVEVENWIFVWILALKFYEVFLSTFEIEGTDSSICLIFCLFVCVTSPDQTTNNRGLKFGTDTSHDYLKTIFLFLWKSDLQKLPCHVDFRIPPRLPCFLKFHFIQWNHWSLHSVFYKNVEDRFWEKIKNFCNITSSPKVLKWQKCDKNIVCYS